MTQNETFLTLREKYNTFIYDRYEISYDDIYMNIKFYFDVPGLVTYCPELKIEKKNILNEHISCTYLEEIVFHIGLIELISYFKCTCSPNVIIKAGYLDEKQIKWFQKLYYNGLGEFLYQNKITITEEELMHITCVGEKRKLTKMDYVGNGNLIAVGGGKDSCVTLEILRNEENNACFMINPKVPSLKCASLSGCSEENIISVKRILDKNMLELNKKGFLNGHTPFSSIVAFISYLCCYLQGKKNIILSNEASANQPTVLNTNINHQYSKTFEFENDFNEYVTKYFGLDIHYFSLLRGLSEFQIAKLFSHYTKYHAVFRSCNLGSKEKEWIWCTNCPKCLFIYIILSPFLYKEQLVEIFGQDLYEREDLLTTFLEILGYAKTKPFECVGTFEEARYAVSLVIQNRKKESLPYLLNYYLEHFALELDNSKILAYNEENNLNQYFDALVKEELKKYE